ncbi:hypothetical protein QAD02_006187 [Eretmocerus hayati]|uniref:Uncharacterized protein n=1 Tax=Eretmocerus hayati TaxID=131215 RepID=A0ACC2N0B4_9HYME|nr:hypothetical protein QAD02_006187 [Eretmocerus hayati]
MNLDAILVIVGAGRNEKGTFGFASNPICGKKRKANGNNTSPKKAKLEPYQKEPWYNAFQKNWTAIENAVGDVNTNTFRQILIDLEGFVTKVKDFSFLNEIPTAILLAGINLPDHELLVQNLIERLKPVTSYIATIHSRDATTLKSLTEGFIYQIINDSVNENGEDEHHLRKSHCTFHALEAWYKINNNGHTPLVIILQDFEGFQSQVVHDFILILSSYLTSMKFVLIIGVATTLHVVHRSLSYDATSKLKCDVFHAKSQVQILSDVLDGIVLNPNITFKLTGQTFRMLVDIFLWYDFSVNGFLQCYKLCMWRHFYQKNERSLCCPPKELEKHVVGLKKNDLKNLKNHEDYPSIAKLLQSKTDNEIKEFLVNSAREFHAYMGNFLTMLKCLFELTVDLPGQPLGKHFREIYANAVGHSNLCETKDYRTAISTVNCLSKEELLKKMGTMVSTLKDAGPSLNNVKKDLEIHVDKIRNASLAVVRTSSISLTPNNKPFSRTSWNKDLQKQAQESNRSEYRKILSNFIVHLDQEIFAKYLKSPAKIPLNEIFCYNDLSTIMNNKRGSLKSVVYTALKDVHSHMQCKCCASGGDILPTHPDLNIIYKLHTEHTKMINLYDWLQSYLYVLNPDGDTDEDVDPHKRARFTRAVSELQFLGFIKATRKKTDHVKRLI